MRRSTLRDIGRRWIVEIVAVSFLDLSTQRPVPRIGRHVPVVGWPPISAKHPPLTIRDSIAAPFERAVPEPLGMAFGVRHYLVLASFKLVAEWMPEFDPIVAIRPTIFHTSRVIARNVALSGSNTL